MSFQESLYSSTNSTHDFKIKLKSIRSVCTNTVKKGRLDKQFEKIYTKEKMRERERDTHHHVELPLRLAARHIELPLG
jgi:hypothetical protein